MIKITVGVLCGFLLGYIIFDRLDIYATNCDPSKYGYTFEQHNRFNDTAEIPFGCLDNTVQVIRITNWKFKFAYIKSLAQFYKWKVTQGEIYGELFESQLNPDEIK